jgi:polyketide biosynthesis acyl carrier protein
MNRQQIFTVIQSNMRSVIEGVDGQEVKESQSMRDFGADSLQIVEVVSRSMKELKIRVPRTELMKAQNLSELLNLFEKATAQQNT